MTTERWLVRLGSGLFTWGALLALATANRRDPWPIHWPITDAGSLALGLVVGVLGLTVVVVGMVRAADLDQRALTADLAIVGLVLAGLSQPTAAPGLWAAGAYVVWTTLRRRVVPS